MEGIRTGLIARKNSAHKVSTLCEKEQTRDMNENKIKMFFDSKNN